jgi:hypothetical protein
MSVRNYDSKIKAYNDKINKFVQPLPGPNFLLERDSGNFDLNKEKNSNNLDFFFNQESPYSSRYPALIICDDSKRANINKNICDKYTDIIRDDCGNRYNIRNLRDSAGILQAGYALNIDLDSHLKNINYYTDKCYYDNWKIAPNTALETCNGLKRNTDILVKNYTPVGRHYEDCRGVCNEDSKCDYTPPTDINCETDVKKRYDFSHNKFQKSSCIKPNEWQYFEKAAKPDLEVLEKYPNGKRNYKLLNSIGQGVQHDYYNFFDKNQCKIFPQERLFNNITKRSMLPNHHNLQGIAPKFLS